MDFAAQLDELAAWECIAQSLHEAAWSRVESMYDMDMMVEDLIDVIDTATAYLLALSFDTNEKVIQKRREIGL